MVIPGTDKEWTDVIAAVAKDIEAYRSSGQPVAGQLDGPALARYIDHTLLKLDATEEQIDKLCEEAKRYNFRTVCVRLNYVPRAIVNLESSTTAVCCVIGFHEGTHPLDQKASEACAALAAGATELDFVLNRELVAAAKWQAIEDELLALRALMPPAPASTAKLILETSQLSKAEVVAGCVLAHYAGFDFVKTSTGFVGRGAEVGDVELMSAAAEVLAQRETVAGQAHKMLVKASGGIRSLEDAVKMIDAGASRLGVSAGVAIVEGVKSDGPAGGY